MLAVVMIFKESGLLTKVFLKCYLTFCVCVCVSLLQSLVDFYYQPSKPVVFLLLTKVFGRYYLTFLVQDYENFLLILLLTIKSYGVLL